MMESEKERDPTMERPAADEDVIDDQKLHQLFKNLEQEWDFIKQRPERSLHTRSAGTRKMIKTLRLLNNSSPRKLMSSLQHRSPPSDRVAWKVRTNDLAVDEILTERRAAIESGKLKGRRLFDEAEDATEMTCSGSLQHRSAPSDRVAWKVRINDLAVEEILTERRAAIESGKLKARRLFDEAEDATEMTCSGFDTGLVQESEVRSVFSYESDNYEDEIWGRKAVLPASCPRCYSHSPSSSSSSSSLRAEKAQRGGTETATLAEKKIACDVGVGTGRWIVTLVWLTIVLVVCTVGVGVISRRNFCLYDGEEVILTPT